jgi:hypothetical protein
MNEAAKVLVDLDHGAHFPQNKQNEPSIARGPSTGALVAGANDKLSLDLCTGTSAPLASPCPFTPARSISAFYRSTDNGKTWSGGYLPGFNTIGRMSGGDPSLDVGRAAARTAASAGRAAASSTTRPREPVPGVRRRAADRLALVRRRRELVEPDQGPRRPTTSRTSTITPWIAVDKSATSPWFGRVQLFWAVYCKRAGIPRDGPDRRRLGRHGRGLLDGERRLERQVPEPAGRRGLEGRRNDVHGVDHDQWRHRVSADRHAVRRRRPLQPRVGDERTRRLLSAPGWRPVLGEALRRLVRRHGVVKAAVSSDGRAGCGDVDAAGPRQHDVVEPRRVVVQQPGRAVHGDYIDVTAGPTTSFIVWTDSRAATPCAAVDAYRTGLYARSKSAVAPNPDTACAASFGNTDTELGIVNQ